MECITVLKTPNVLSKDVPLEQCSGQKAHAGTCRFCSHTVKSFAFGVLFLCLLISLVSSLMLQLKVRELTTQVDLNKEIIYDILHARHLQEEKERHATITEFNSRQSQRKDNGRRHGRTAPCRTVPHFQLTGAGTVNSQRISENDLCDPSGMTCATILNSDDDVFTWKDEGQILPNGNVNFGAEHDGTGSYVKYIIVKHPGLYYVFAQIHVNGYDGYASNPRFGFILKQKRGDNTTDLGRAYVTQVNRGSEYYRQPASYPQDAVGLTGLFPLRSGDRIFIQRPVGDDRIRYSTLPMFSHFGAFLVEEPPNYNC